MKKILFCISLVASLFIFYPVKIVDAVTSAQNCSISASPPSIKQGQSTQIVIGELETGKTYQVIGYHGTFAWLNEPSYTAGGTSVSFPLTNAADGHYDVRVNSGGVELCFWAIDVTPLSTTGSSVGISAPKDWLKTVNPGFPPPWGANFGLDFFTKQLVPFLVWAGVFFTIILSLIFLLVGGIMWITGGGNKEGMAKAKATVTYALVGLVLGLSSVIILRFLEKFFYS